MQPSFVLDNLPRIEFGRGSLMTLPARIAQWGSRVLLVTGSRSFSRSANWRVLLDLLAEQKMEWWHCHIDHEPSPQLVDTLVKQFAGQTIDVVVGIGGGSALDAAKAIAGLLRLQHSVMDFLEGVGPELDYPGESVPFIAVPTTAGTGSEATKNAVLSVAGKDGFKKSFRHEQLMAKVAIVDSALLASCPPAVIAANGMDALTQCLESCVSSKANRMTTVLAETGLRCVRDSLLNWYHYGAEAQQAQDDMAYAALLSGITLARAGLGSVHGLAAPLGAFFPIPHGVACGRLLAVATEVNIRAMQQREPDNPALTAYHRVAECLLDSRYANITVAASDLTALLHEWTEVLHIPRLAAYGVSEQDITRIITNARGSSMQTNPIRLDDEEIAEIVQRSL